MDGKKYNQSPRSRSILTILTRRPICPTLCEVWYSWWVCALRTVLAERPGQTMYTKVSFLLGNWCRFDGSIIWATTARSLQLRKNQVQWCQGGRDHNVHVICWSAMRSRTRNSHPASAGRPRLMTALLWDPSAYVLRNRVSEAHKCCYGYGDFSRYMPVVSRQRCVFSESDVDVCWGSAKVGIM